MVNVPVRGAGDVLTATEKLTRPLPAPEAPDVMLIQGALLVAFQLQEEVDAATAAPLCPPPGWKSRLDGSIVNAQPCATEAVGFAPADGGGGDNRMIDPMIPRTSKQQNMD
jgi:hypothetical protein